MINPEIIMVRAHRVQFMFLCLVYRQWGYSTKSELGNPINLPIAMKESFIGLSVVDSTSPREVSAKITTKTITVNNYSTTSGDLPMYWIAIGR